MRYLRPLQSSFTSGELDPKLAARLDVKVYYNGVSKARNVRLLPGGGFARRPGSVYGARLRKQVSAVSFASATVTAPRGGTAANAIDESESTKVTTVTNISTLDPYVILHIDFASAQSVTYFDIRQILITAGTATNSVKVQYSADNVTFTDFGAAIDSVTTTATNRRRSVDGSSVSARYWRIARIGATDLGANQFEIGEVKLWLAGASLSASRCHQLKFSNDQTYKFVLSDRNVAVYRARTWQCDIAIPHTSAQISEMSKLQSLDTMILFHASVQTWKIERKGAHDEWHDQAIAFDIVPTHNYGDTALGSITVTLTTTAIGVATATASSAIFTSAMIGWNITNLDGVGTARITAFTSSTVVTVKNTEVFASVNLTALNWSLDELAWSSTRGYPRCGTFHEGGLYMGGTTALPQTAWRSVVGQYFKFDRQDGKDDASFEFTLDSDDVCAIYAMNSGRHLQLFTSTAEFYLLPNNDPITPDTVVAKRSTEVGMSGPGLPVLKVEGAVMFIQAEGGALREFLFTDLEQAYTAGNVSLLSSHLISSPVDAALRKATNTSDSDLVLVVNNDGTMATLNTLRSQQITGWAKWETDGDYLSVGCDDTEIFYVVERNLTGVGLDRYIEFFDEDFVVDSAVEKTTGLPSASVTGLAHLGTITARCIADGSVLSSEVVAAGAVTLDRNATTRAEVGLDFPDVKQLEVARLVASGATDFAAYQSVYGSGTTTSGDNDTVWVRDMPAAVDLPEGKMVGLKKRIPRVTLRLFETKDGFVGASGDTPERLTFRSIGADLLDQSPPAYTGDITVDGFQGWTDDGQVEILQRDPAPMTVLGLSKSIMVN